MAEIKIYAPNTEHSGHTAGVEFRSGVGSVEEDNAAALSYFERHGYGIGSPVSREEAEPSDVAPPAKRKGRPEQTAATSTEGPPPKVGKGSGTAEWTAYAEKLGIDPGEMSRAEIIAAVEAKVAGGEEGGGEKEQTAAPSTEGDDGGADGSE